MKPAYTPRADSLAGRMLAFFKANPDEELSLHDIAEKYDAVRLSIHTLLAPSVEAGLLRRDQSSGDWHYKLGDGQAPESPPPKPAGAAPWKAATEDVDPLSIALEENIPLTSKRASRRTDWSQLLARMQPGHSCVLPRVKRTAIGKAITAAQEAGPAKYAVRVLDKTTMRLWRVE